MTYFPPKYFLETRFLEAEQSGVSGGSLSLPLRLKLQRVANYEQTRRYIVENEGDGDGDNIGLAQNLMTTAT
jgi:hypothetical protein